MAKLVEKLFLGLMWLASDFFNRQVSSAAQPSAGGAASVWLRQRAGEVDKKHGLEHNQGRMMNDE
jgi:hypothetical protein